MNYKSACLQTNVVKQLKPTVKSTVAMDEKAKFNRSCEKAVRTLYLRWEKYKQDYIELHGEDMYNYMYLTPNYWVMPEEEEEEEEESQDEEANYSSDNSF